MSPYRHLFKGALLAALGLYTCAGFAQHESRWYKVELMVFTHEGAATDERFDPTPALEYPQQYRFLLHPEQIRALAEQHDGKSELDDYGRLTLLPNLPPPEPDTPDIPYRDPNDAAVATELPLTAPAVDEEPAADEPAAPRPTPFIALPAAQQEFRGKAAYMARTGEYRILFHEAWAQPVMGENDAIPIVLDRSGDTGDWPELQGSIKLHVARYLYLETRLWLNTAGTYLPGDWRMPAAPLGPPSVITVEPPPDPNEIVAGEESSLAGVTVYETEALLEPVEEEVLEPLSPWRHAVLLEQKRRMRSLEVHYLDHPLFSVVVRLEPLNDEQLRAMAEAEEPLLPEEEDPLSLN
ncbi:CsiV family protein [Haliea sp. E17]|uniref:CsiV family protein n=1 Tax=Haliea sp. E17 TaxID=3401576 RepID=UPI003AAD1CB2